MFNELIVREGYAQLSTFPPDVKYEERIRQAQREAHEAGAGLWSACAEPEPESEPEQLSGRGSAAVGDSCPDGYPIKGNHSSSGELIYHPPGGAFYERTNPEECFATAADAEATGYPSQR